MRVSLLRPVRKKAPGPQAIGDGQQFARLVHQHRHRHADNAEDGERYHRRKNRDGEHDILRIHMLRFAPKA